MNTQTLKPAPGRKVRRPESPHAHLAEAGETVHLTPYWRRRLAAGDVFAVDPAVKIKKGAD
ncbi:MAG: DUF2635 domain-containing protein [Pseudomonadota bacterium]